MGAHPARTFWSWDARTREACAIGLSALEAAYVGVDAHAQMLGRLTAMRGRGRKLQRRHLAAIRIGGGPAALDQMFA
jgi:hypothetical protein